MIYVSPAVDVGRDNHVEELIPVFRSGILSMDYYTAS
jgi:hypothetical protein